MVDIWPFPLAGQRRSEKEVLQLSIFPTISGSQIWAREAFGIKMELKLTRLLAFIPDQGQWVKKPKCVKRTMRP
jgi:hypothetical protein